MNPDTRPRHLDSFVDALRRSDFDPRCKEQAADRVARLTSHRNRDEVAKTVRHLTTAVRNAGKGRPSRRAARKLIRYAASCADFDELARRAKAFRGDHNRAVRRTKERRERDLERELRIDEVYSVREIRTTDHLRSVGRTLRNCLAGRTGSGYRDELRNGESEFWAVLRHGEIAGVVSITIATREIDEMAGPENDDLDLPPETLGALLGQLGATVADGRDDGPLDAIAGVGLVVGTCAVVGVAAYGIWRCLSRGWRASPW